MTTKAPTRSPIEIAQQAFAPAPGYLDAATMGLPPIVVADALHEAVEQWQAGDAGPVAYDEHIQQARAAYAALVGVPVGQVATGSQASVLAGMVAASVPDGAEVLAIADDFTSMIFPFLVQAHRGVSVRLVPLERLADEVGPHTYLVAYSLAQSACGSLVDAAAVRAAAREHGALTFCDLTQAAGWLPVDAGEDDLTVCAAYKWLCQPRGTAYLTVAAHLIERLVPVNAGWYAGESVWDSCYGPEMHLAKDARRFDVSPAWLCWVGASAAADVFAAVPAHEVRRHDAALADALRAHLGQEPAGRPVVTVADPSGQVASAFADRGARVSSRAGRVRIAFHLWNTEQDVELAAEAVGTLSG